MPICTKMISSWVRKVLGISKTQLSLSILHGAAVSAALVAGVSLVSILQAGNWGEFLPLLDIIFLLTSQL